MHTINVPYQRCLDLAVLLLAIFVPGSGVGKISRAIANPPSAQAASEQAQSSRHEPAIKLPQTQTNTSVLTETAKDAVLLIITPTAFAQTLQPYVQFKMKQLPTKLVTLESILSQQDSGDDAQKVKQFLFENWKHGKLRYALLVGDADVFPVRYMTLDRNTQAAWNIAFYPSDLYYGDLADRQQNFENWNGAQHDFHGDYFAEVCGEHNKEVDINFDQIDYLPEIAVGRWPVSTAQEAQRLARKTIDYHESLANQSENSTAAMLAISGWVDSRPTMDFIADAISNSFQVKKLYYADKDQKDSSIALPTSESFLQTAENGARLIFHAGHGSDHTWEKCFAQRDIPKLNNANHLPIMVSAGCSTARLATLPPYEPYLDKFGKHHVGTDHGEVFNMPPPAPACYQTGSYNSTGLGEQLLRKQAQGAVAYIGCNTGSQPCGLTLLKGFATSIKEQPTRNLGDHWVSAVHYYYHKENLSTLKPTRSWYPPSIYFQGMKFMLYGDPSLPMPLRSVNGNKQLSGN